MSLRPCVSVTSSRLHSPSMMPLTCFAAQNHGIRLESSIPRPKALVDLADNQIPRAEYRRIYSQPQLFRYRVGNCNPSTSSSRTGA